MKRLIAVAAALITLALAGTAAATLVPGVFDPGNTGCPVSTFSNGVLHLEKNCPTATNAAAGADITGLEGQTFTSASFTLASTSQCQGGSPRFDVVTTTGLFFLGCNNVIPNGTTYTFTPATLAAAGNQVAFPTGTVQSIDVLIDVEGTADLTNITVNGQVQVPAPTTPTSKDQCKNGGWKTFTNPAFKNQGDCVSFVATGGKNLPSG
ncbi:MAG: hypothetical protein E6G50_01480 [Actinobacteria bacterium]|nr:MAG: hypothetical protein E6G50_01480 [Actinomycetota bacterium]